jgi:hypothetical protein
MVENIPEVQQIGNPSGLDSSLISPLGLDSLQGGTLEQKNEESPGDNNSKMQSKLGNNHNTLDYSQNTLNLRSKTPVIDFNAGENGGNGTHHQKFKIRLDQGETFRNST